MRRPSAPTSSRCGRPEATRFPPGGQLQPAIPRRRHHGSGLELDHADHAGNAMKPIRLLVLVVALAVVYRRFLCSPILNWGATAGEASARLPGDELLDDADGVSTRAI